MPEFHRVTADFSVAAQLSQDDFAQAAAEGFKMVINNRPDSEMPGQLSSSEAEAAAKAAGLEYRAIPFRGPPSPAAVAEMAAALETARGGGVLAYCRSGSRSITAWAMAEALAGTRAPSEIIALAAEAGYDLSGVREALSHLQPR